MKNSGQKTDSEYLVWLGISQEVAYQHAAQYNLAPVKLLLCSKQQVLHNRQIVLFEEVALAQL